MRHGTSEANEQGIITSLPEHALDGYGLTAKGLEQARGAAEAVRKEVDQRGGPPARRKDCWLSIQRTGDEGLIL